MPPEAKQKRRQGLKYGYMLSARLKEPRVGEGWGSWRRQSELHPSS